MNKSTEGILLLQAEIDQIDTRIVDLLGARFKRSREIGRLKKEEKLPPIDPDRPVKIRAGFLERSVEAEIDEGMAAQIISLIIDQTIAERRRSI